MTNKEIVEEFTQVVFNERHLELIDKYMHDDYVQHNPTVAQGKAGFLDFAENRFFKYNPNLHIEIKHIYEDGDVVVSHNLAVCEPGVNENIVFDVYKLRDGKLAEHWDCIQHLTDEQLKDTDALF